MQEYTYFDQRIHFLSQTLAKINRRYVTKKEDDSHTNLFFDYLGNRMMGRWIYTEKRNLILTLNFSSQCLEWLDDSYRTLVSIPYVGKRMDQLEDALLEEVSNLGLNPEGAMDALHYRIPAYDFKEEVFASLSSDEWMYFRRLANMICGSLLGHLQCEGEIRIWPHHFDTGVYVTPNEALGLGFGLAMEDEMVGDPYFYFAGYGLKSKLNYSNPPMLSRGVWKMTDSFKGSVLSLSKLLEKEDAHVYTLLDEFVKENLKWFLK